MFCRILWQRAPITFSCLCNNVILVRNDLFLQWRREKLKWQIEEEQDTFNILSKWKFSRIDHPHWLNTKSGNHLVTCFTTQGIGKLGQCLWAITFLSAKVFLINVWAIYMYLMSVRILTVVWQGLADTALHRSLQGGAETHQLRAS